MFIVPQYLERQIRLHIPVTIFKKLLRFLPDHQFVSFPAAALVLIWQIHAAGKSHLPAAGPHFVGDIALNVGRVAGKVFVTCRLIVETCYSLFTVLSLPVGTLRIGIEGERVSSI